MGEEFFDADLAEMVNYTDETMPTEMPVMERKATEKVLTKSEPMDATYVPVKRKRGAAERIFRAMMWFLICGGISMLMWWFWINEMMVSDAAYFCIWLSSIVCAFGVAWSVK